jgi:sugar phosphate isomerase/epimerase
MFIGSAAAAGAAVASAQTTAVRARFELSCMTLPWQMFPFERALEGVVRAGYRKISLGSMVTPAGGKRSPLLPPEAPAADAVRLAKRCRDAGLEPQLLFGNFYPENAGALDVYKRRVEQAHAAGIRYVLSFASPQSTDEDAKKWVPFLEQIGPVAQSAGVVIGVKPHGGVTATGRKIVALLAKAPSPAIRAFFDAGNVWFYPNVDALEDLREVAPKIGGFAMKDFRASATKRYVCAPGLGVVDHYKLLGAVAANEGEIPLAVETVFEPLHPRPDNPDEIDVQARRTREFLETVLRGLMKEAV